MPPRATAYILFRSCLVNMKPHRMSINIKHLSVSKLSILIKHGGSQTNGSLRTHTLNFYHWLCNLEDFSLCTWKQDVQQNLVQTKKMDKGNKV